MSDETNTEDHEVRRKGRGNAILTYETVAEIATKVALLVVKLDVLGERLSTADQKHADHEVRLRAIELLAAAQGAGGKATKDTALWVWTAALTLSQIGISLYSVLHR